VETLFAKVDVARFEYSTEMSWPLYPKQEPIKEPKQYLAVQDVMAVPGLAILATRPKGSAVPEGEAADPLLAQGNAGGKPKEAKADDGGDFAPRRGGAGVGATGDVAADLGLGAAGPLPGQAGPAGANPAGGNMMMVGMTSQQSGRGARYVSIRGVFPLREQLMLYAKAVNELGVEKVANLFDIVDFELQRQTAVAGSNPWSGKWEPVNFKVAMDVLTEADDFDADPVDPGVTDQVITMPLPRRLVGYWGDRATHPRIKEFVLSPEEMEQMMLINQKILEQFEKDKANQPPAPVPKSKFASQQHDLRQARSAVMGGAGGMQMFNQMNQELNTDQNLKEALSRRMQQADAAGRLLLFRYLDFDVEPGNAYRYRVRLTLRNPNWNRPIETVVSPEVATGQTRDTDWSEPTSPVIVPEDADVFLANTTPAKSVSLPSAKFSVFQWLPEFGTMVKGDLVTELGQFIGGKTKTELIDPAKETFKESDVELKTGEVLVDVADRPTVEQTEHPDLVLPTRRWAAGSDLALVVNEFGELVNLDAFSRAGDLKRQQSRLSQQNQAFEYLKNKASAAGAAGEGGALDAAMQQYQQQIMGVGDGGEMGGPKPKKRPGKNSIRKDNPMPAYGPANFP
jgi:hypothetical protein